MLVWVHSSSETSVSHSFILGDFVKEWAARFGIRPAFVSADCPRAVSALRN